MKKQTLIRQIEESFKSFKDILNNPPITQTKKLDELLEILCTYKVQISIKPTWRYIKKCIFCNNVCSINDFIDFPCNNCFRSAHKACLSDTALLISPDLIEDLLNISCSCNKKIPYQVIVNCFSPEKFKQIKTNSVCFFCKESINSLSSSIKFKTCKCQQKFHDNCLKKIALQVSPDLEEGELSNGILCNFCRSPLNLNTIKECFLKNEFQNIKDEAASRKYIQQLIDEDEKKKLEREILANNKQDDCAICGEKKIISKDFITLDCNHRYCKDCVKDLAVNKIKEMKCSKNDISCPECKEPISIYILQNVLDKETFNAYDNFVVTHYQSKIFTEEIAIRCPNSECFYFFVMAKNSGITHHTCEVCKTHFCVNGCKKPHDGKTCEQYRKELMDQEAEEQFNLLVQREKLRQCPKCNIWVHKITGCNHITCKRCKAEFCYICGGANYGSCGHQFQ